MNKKSTNINDKFGQLIHEDDKLLLEFETIKMQGIAKWSEENNEWELYKDEGNHVGIEHNKERIRIIS